MTHPWKRRLQNALLALASTAAVFILAIVVDRVIGRISPPSELDRGLLFSPYSAVRYETIEFDCRVQINNLGFRGADTTLEKSHKTRIVAIGDSFTFGWGVDLEETWVKRLETELIAEGHDVEILNLGVPGFGPGEYADTAEKLIPILKPDLVLVGLLQGNDLEQLDYWAPGQSPKSVVSEVIHLDDGPPAAGFITQRLLPNLTRVVTRVLRSATHRAGPEIEIREVWQRQASRYLAAMSEPQREQFDRMSTFVRRALLEGRLNPAHFTWLFPLSLGEPANNDTEQLVDQPAASNAAPDAELTPSASEQIALAPDLDLDSKLMRHRINVCATQLKRLKAVADRYGAPVVVVSIPEPGYVRPSGWNLLVAPLLSEETRTSLDRKFTTDVPDEAAKAACSRAAMPFLSVTDAFRARAHGQRCFYEFDGHYDSNGHALFTELIAPKLEPYLP